MLKPKELASVATKLQVPLIVSDILNGTECLDDEAEYTLHEAISEMQPDSALICIALCGVKVANVTAAPSTRILEIECRKIIDEYALLWLQNAEGKNVDEEAALETLAGTAEDLEGLAGLFENCLPALERIDSPDAAILCEILTVQAQAQALVAEAYFEALDQPAKHAIPTHVMADNIILFPVRNGK